ncbi:CAP domain-containing protein [Streptomyces sp. MUM 203J]|uniref:CAP domain-containing protein n=1 Tax=Streptomyces sp. MUM 203J TaxID=2791990 RepID=UPI001F04D1F8|nr:CAP domain-containing protein [Streptomyces sp. MUM 203J]MCH0541264.1 CAP domain-containing protein [Streptomyces sp. MUM 203J]
MGRHRRSDAAASAATTGGATEDHASGRRRRRKRSGGLPVKGGLLGASAAMAVGAVAVASGLLPGGDTFTLGSSSPDEQIRSGDPSGLNAQGGSTDGPGAGGASASAPATPTAPTSAAAPSTSPSPSPSRTTASPSPSPSKTAEKKKPSPTPTKVATTAPRTTAPAPTQKPKPPTTPDTDVSRADAAEAAVLDLVNKERAKAGCSPVRASKDLGALARAYSTDMAERDFFSHTDPDGNSPWDRAAKAGIEGLGGENIARGQADAAAVMEAWMNSEGHRANILNCDFNTLGVGVHFADGGPWWTQNFGF